MSKSELDDAERVREQLADETGLHVLAVSAVTGDGLQHLLYIIAQRLGAEVDDKPR